MVTSCFTVYDVARKDTFDSLSMWLQEVQQFSMGGGEQVVKLLVGNKIDQERAVSREVSTHALCFDNLHLISSTLRILFLLFLNQSPCFSDTLPVIYIILISDASFLQVAEEWAKSKGMLFLEASAKTKEGISQVFQEVVQKVRML